MSQTEPGDREEMLLQGILNGDTTTNIEPGSRKEMLLKAILEEGGGGGSGGGAGFPVFDTESYTDGTITTNNCSVTFTDDLIGDQQKISPFYLRVATSGYAPLPHRTVLCIPSITYEVSGGRSYVCLKVTTVWEGFIKLLYAKATNDNPLKYVFYKNFTSSSPSGTYLEPYNFANMVNQHGNELKSPILQSRTDTGQKEGDIPVIAENGTNTVTFTTFETLWENAGITFDGAVVADLQGAAAMFEQVFTGLKTMAAASPETTITKYVTVGSDLQILIVGMIQSWVEAIKTDKKSVFMALNDGVFAVTDVYKPSNGTQQEQMLAMYATGVYKECDFTNDKIYDIRITFNATKLYFQCTCYEATSLM